MGQQNQKKIYTRQTFQEFYEETLSHQYFSAVKTFGFRKSNIHPLLNYPLPKLKHSPNSEQIQANKIYQKTIKKKSISPAVYPYSCLGLLLINFNDRQTFATGCLIGKNYVLTAASNVYDKQNSQQGTQIKFVLNVSANSGDIYLIKKRIFFHQKFIQEAEGSHRYNYAVLQIYKKQIHKQESQQKPMEKGMLNIQENPGLIYGYLGIHTKFTGMQNIYVYGYSSEPTQNNELEHALRGQKIDKLICKNSSIGYRMQTQPSQTGSPVLIRRNQYYHIVGIHISGKKQLSSGLQFDQKMRMTINSWIGQIQGEIDLSNKKIDSMGISLFTIYDWHNMAIINLDKNNIICEGLILLTKVSWPALRQLHLDQNYIVKLEFDTGNIKNLQNLHMAKNNIKEIGILSELLILRVLDLSQNKIQSIDELIVLKYLERLNLNRNKLSRLPNEIGRMSQLKKLHVSRNELESIPADILKLKELTALSLDGNKSRFKGSDIITKLEHQNVEVILQ